MSEQPSITLEQVLEFVRRPDIGMGAHQLIVQALNSRVRAKRAEAKAGFRPGMMVKFFSNRSFREVTGRILKVNRINIDLIEDGTGTKWRVSPSLLKAV